jgi:hypothetical protein
MGRPKKVVVEVPEEVKVKEEVIVQQGDNIEFHLDRDPNDPRNAAKPNKLPSLND